MILLLGLPSSAVIVIRRKAFHNANKAFLAFAFNEAGIGHCQYIDYSPKAEENQKLVSERGRCSE
jgi:hypothetical protein